jgi:hypothetical protein
MHSEKISQAEKSQKEVAPIPGDRPESFLMSNDGDRSAAGFKSVSEDPVIEEQKVKIKICHVLNLCFRVSKEIQAKSLSELWSIRVIKIYQFLDPKIPVEESKSRKGSLKSVQEDDEGDKEQTIYIKQTIESYRDSQHSQKLDEKEVTYSMTIPDNKTDPKTSQRTKTITKKSSVHPQNPSKNDPQTPPINFLDQPEDKDSEGENFEAE